MYYFRTHKYTEALEEIIPFVKQALRVVAWSFSYWFCYASMLEILVGVVSHTSFFNDSLQKLMGCLQTLDDVNKKYADKFHLAMSLSELFMEFGQRFKSKFTFRILELQTNLFSAVSYPRALLYQSLLKWSSNMNNVDDALSSCKIALTISEKMRMNHETALIHLHIGRYLCGFFPPFPTFSLS
jgi:hypothetical protein